VRRLDGALDFVKAAIAHLKTASSRRRSTQEIVFVFVRVNSWIVV